MKLFHYVSLNEYEDNIYVQILLVPHLKFLPVSNLCLFVGTHSLPDEKRFLSKVHSFGYVQGTTERRQEKSKFATIVQVPQFWLLIPI